MYSVPKLEDYSPEALDTASRELLQALEQESAAVQNEAEWKAFRDRWMARKSGILTQINDIWLKAAPAANKRDVGQKVNQLKQQVEETIAAAQQRIAGAGAEAKLAAERIDVTLPGIHRELGVRHPVLRTMDEIVAVFVAMGYSVAEGPEVESDYYNFEALNFPPNHPARDTQDTLFIAGQERAAAARPPAAAHAHLSGADSHHGAHAASGARDLSRQGAPQRRARRDPLARLPSARRALRRYQYHPGRPEGNARPRHEGDVRQLGQDQFSPVVLPFYGTELSRCRSRVRSAERRAAASARAADGSSCSARAWSIPAVFGFVGYDPEKYSGFAFGMGIERMTMLRYNIDDIQQFFLGDVRFLEQFG